MKPCFPGSVAVGLLFTAGLRIASAQFDEPRPAAEPAPLPSGSFPRVIKLGPDVVAAGATGLSISQKLRPLPGSVFRLLETTLTNPGQAEVRATNTGATDCLLRLDDDADPLRYRPLTYRNDLWFYEMEQGGETRVGLPKVYSFNAAFGLGEANLSSGGSVCLDHHEALPLAVLADRTDRGGLALALVRNGPWRLRFELTSDGWLHLKLAADDERAPVVLKPGQSVQLPLIALAAYRGPWVQGMSLLRGLSAPENRAAEVQPLRSGLLASMQAARKQMEMPDNAGIAELDFWAMIQQDWRHQDKIVETPEAYASATAHHLEKARQLRADLQRGRPERFLANEGNRLSALAISASRTDLDLAEWRSLYGAVRSLKRRIALSNPLLDFGPLLFCKRVPTSYSHLVMQYFGWRARPGGGLFILEQPGHSLTCRQIRTPELARGNFLEPRLSYDARKIVFSFVHLDGKDYDFTQLKNDVDDGFYHIFEVNVDGTGLRQLTRGPYDDLMPTYLPDGGIAFSSTRRRGYARCFGAQFSPRWHVYTLHRMDRDGGQLRPLSFHDTNEWFPTVSHAGQILYARWDYIDRDAVTHQNLWISRPDGSNPIALWGNATPSPHCSFQAQPIPDSPKILFTASAHHSITAGSIAILDPTGASDGHSVIRRITPEVPFPEAEGTDIREYYSSPWPLSENYFLVSYCPRPLVWEPGANEPNALGLYLLDAFSNRELIYRDPAIGSENACPLAPRPVPPVLASSLPDDLAPATGEITLIDVYQGLGKAPRGTIKELRIIQIFPKTTPVGNAPPIGIAGEENGRAILGTVPVEPDGSARFIVPAQRPILFQALDADGFAYQTMRTITYVQPGEKVSCLGCHEYRRGAPASGAPVPAALRRTPSSIEPGSLGGRPFSYVEVVQPVLNKHCVGCHGAQQREGDIDLTGAPLNGFTQSYWTLCGDRNSVVEGTGPQKVADAFVPRFAARNQIQVTPPGGKYGARGSRLMKILRGGHCGVKLNPDELRRLAAWIDLNAIFFGINNPNDQARQLRAERVEMPDVQ